MLSNEEKELFNQMWLNTKDNLQITFENYEIDEIQKLFGNMEMYLTLEQIIDLKEIVKNWKK